VFKNLRFPRTDADQSSSATRRVASERRRLELWLEYKRLHLGFAQALNSLTYGYSSTLALIKHSMLAEYEVRKLTGEEPKGSASLIVGSAMADAVGRCRAGYTAVSSKAFDDAALTAVADDLSPYLIQRMLAVTTAPFDTADSALVEIARRHGLEDPERIRRHTPEIRKMHSHLRTHFITLAKRAGLA
jgi:hypothetical protein